MDCRFLSALVGGLVVTLGALGCDDVVEPPTEVSAAQALTDALQFSDPSVVCRPRSAQAGPIDIPGGAASAVLLPGQGLALNLDVGDPAGASHVAVDFGGDCVFEVPVSRRGTQLVVDAALQNDVCQRLSAVCHDIACSETVFTNEGTISSQEAMKLVLACHPDGCDGVSTQGCTTPCQADEVCHQGQCVDAAAGNSCAKRVPVCCPDRNDACAATFGACYCDAFCVEAGDCCDDACVRCGFCE